MAARRVARAAAGGTADAGGGGQWYPNMVVGGRRGPLLDHLPNQLGPTSCHHDDAQRTSRLLYVSLQTTYR